MAKKKSGHHRSRGFLGGMGGLAKAAIFGAIGDELATQASARGINVVPQQDKVGGAIGGYMATKSVTGAVVGVVGGMAKDMLLRGQTQGISGNVSLIP